MFCLVMPIADAFKRTWNQNKKQQGVKSIVPQVSTKDPSLKSVARFPVRCRIASVWLEQADI